jgi:hypothetical protein
MAVTFLILSISTAEGNRNRLVRRPEKDQLFLSLSFRQIRGSERYKNCKAKKAAGKA